MTEPKAKRGETKSVSFPFEGDDRKHLLKAVEISNRADGPGVATASTFTRHYTMKAADEIIAKDEAGKPTAAESSS